MARLWRSLFLPVLLGFFFLGIYLYFYLGANRPVTLEQVALPEMKLVFKEHLGAYHKINAAIEEVEAWAKKNNLSCPQTFGRYLDDPKVVDEDRLRSEAGCIMAAEAPLELTEPGFHQQILRAGQYVRASFAGSPAIGPWRVYPRLKEFIAENHLQTEAVTIEIYQLDGKGGMTTTYLVPLLANSATH